jgi:pimeloyl-ACP methyl ester carboxylesterase
VRHPETVRALVLVIPPTAWETRAAQREIYENAALYVRMKGKAAYVDAVQRLPRIPIFAGHPELGPMPPDVTEELLPFVMEGAAASDFPSVDSIRSLNIPTLVLAWDTDPGHPVSTAAALDSLLPRSTSHVASTVTAIQQWGQLTAEFLGAL